MRDCIYRAQRTEILQTKVWVRWAGQPETDFMALPLCTHFRSHATRFQWGYAGSGPAQLALALCVHAATAGVKREYQPGGIKRALAVYQDFKAAVLVNLTLEDWWMTKEDVRSIIETIEDKDASAIRVVVKLRGPRSIDNGYAATLREVK